MMKSAAIAVLAAAAISTPVLAEGAKQSSAWVGPAQPIPYSQLKAYQKASPLKRATHDWSAAAARTGVASDTSARVEAARPTAGRDARPSSVSGAPAGPVNPLPASETEPPV